MMNLAIKIAVCFFALVHVYEPEPQEVIIPITEENAVAIVETTETPTKGIEIPIKNTETPTEGFVQYSAYGITPPLEWQIGLYTELQNQGIAWYWKFSFCQIMQESRWNRWSDNGQDCGIAQQKEIYWASRAQRYGMPGADIWDVYAQFHVYACMMKEYLRIANNDIGWALSLYFYGNGEYAEKYVADVLSHMDYLKEVK